MTQRDNLQRLLFERMHEYTVQAGCQFDLNEETRLLGYGAPLDSLGLVMVLAGFEASINEAFGTAIVLADERAMSMERSPFRTVASLIDYAASLVDEHHDKFVSGDLK
jgi:hypothetical protein